MSTIALEMCSQTRLTLPVCGVLSERHGLDQNVVAADGRDGMVLQRNFVSLSMLLAHSQLRE